MSNISAIIIVAIVALALIVFFYMQYQEAKDTRLHDALRKQVEDAAKGQLKQATELANARALARANTAIDKANLEVQQNERTLDKYLDRALNTGVRSKPTSKLD